jgi:hypothetical protein
VIEPDGDLLFDRVDAFNYSNVAVEHGGLLLYYKTFLLGGLSLPSPVMMRSHTVFAHPIAHPKRAEMHVPER